VVAGSVPVVAGSTVGGRICDHASWIWRQRIWIDQRRWRIEQPGGGGSEQPSGGASGSTNGGGGSEQPGGDASRSTCPGGDTATQIQAQARFGLRDFHFFVF
jgi:hypothetical protein